MQLNERSGTTTSWLRPPREILKEGSHAMMSPKRTCLASKRPSYLETIKKKPPLDTLTPTISMHQVKLLKRCMQSRAKQTSLIFLLQAAHRINALHKSANLPVPKQPKTVEWRDARGIITAAPSWKPRQQKDCARVGVCFSHKNKATPCS